MILSPTFEKWRGSLPNACPLAKICFTFSCTAGGMTTNCSSLTPFTLSGGSGVGDGVGVRVGVAFGSIVAVGLPGVAVTTTGVAVAGTGVGVVVGVAVGSGSVVAGKLGMAIFCPTLMSA